MQKRIIWRGSSPAVLDDRRKPWTWRLFRTRDDFINRVSIFVFGFYEASITDFINWKSVSCVYARVSNLETHRIHAPGYEVSSILAHPIDVLQRILGDKLAGCRIVISGAIVC